MLERQNGILKQECKEKNAHHFPMSQLRVSVLFLFRVFFLLVQMTRHFSAVQMHVATVVACEGKWNGIVTLERKCRRQGARDESINPV